MPARSHPAWSATHVASSLIVTSAGASVVIAEYSVPTAPIVRPFPSDRWRPTLDRWRPDTAQPHSVVTQLYPSSPGSRSSTPCYDLAEFDSENSQAAMSDYPVSDVMYVVSVDMFSATSPFAPLNPQGSPVSTEVVESPVSHLSSVQLSPNRVRLDFDLDLSICFLCLRRPRDPAGIYPFCHRFRHRSFVVTCISGCGLSARRGG